MAENLLIVDNSTENNMQDLPIPALAALAGALVFWLIAACLKRGNDSLRAEIQAMRHSAK